VGDNATNAGMFTNAAHEVRDLTFYTKDVYMFKCFAKIGLLIYGLAAILFCVSSPLLAEFLYSYGPDFVRQGTHLKVGVVASWILAALVAVVSGGVAIGVSSDIKCE
jgi:hypothetical protein